MSELVDAPAAPLPLSRDCVLPVRRSMSDAGLYRTTIGDIADVICNRTLVALTQTEYDALSPPDANTLYFIVG